MTYTTNMRPTQVAEYLGVGLSTFWKYANSGDIKVYKISKGVTIVKKEDLQIFLNTFDKVEEEDIITLKEVSEYLAIGRSTVSLYISQGKLKTYRIFSKAKKQKGARVMGGEMVVLRKQDVSMFIKEGR